MTYDKLLEGIAEAAPTMAGSTLKLLLYLIGRVLYDGKYTIEASDRTLSQAAGIGRGQLPNAKRALAEWITVTATRGTASSFTFPHDWFPPQQLTFISTGGPETGPLLARKPVHTWPENRYSDGPETGPSGPETGPLWPGNRATLALKPGHSGPETGPSGPETGPVYTQNQQHSGGSSTRLDSTQELETIEETSRLEGIFNHVQIPEDKQADAHRLRLALHAFMQQCGNYRTAERPPKDEILAKCLAIAGVDELLIALRDVSNSRKANPGAYIWFVVMFLDQIGGIPHKTTSAYLKQRKERKPPQRQAAADFRLELVGAAVNQVKRLR